MAWLDKISWPVLLIIAVFLGFAPFQPEPHLVEKLRLLMQGALVRPLDIGDLLWHGAPTVVVLLKAMRFVQQRES